MIGVERAIRFICQRIRGKNPAAAEFQRLVEVGVLPFDHAHRTGAFVVPDRVGLPAQSSWCVYLELKHGPHLVFLAG